MVRGAKSTHKRTAFSLVNTRRDPPQPIDAKGLREPRFSALGGKRCTLRRGVSKLRKILSNSQKNAEKTLPCGLQTENSLSGCRDANTGLSGPTIGGRSDERRPKDGTVRPQTSGKHPFVLWCSASLEQKYAPMPPTSVYQVSRGRYVNPLDSVGFHPFNRRRTASSLNVATMDLISYCQR